ncbi:MULTISPECIES: hypothetical protein [unclassified Mesorhizobium]|uniref:hypothetical protein n=1 Tax=unclassified Mesorhizobium TaxID=325217 RepID=UPI0024165A64|nr:MULTISPECIES: hypothetical protein [unclassified Mesorhizobium]MDG4904544.1 hypothetical protein [Mesorhizobium sp. WSM4962]MDG4920314.1 hypothetical protein [Mesorhizobium sp. WSM4989]
MDQIGMFCLGAVIASIIFYGITSATKWDNPLSLIGGAISAAVVGGVPLFIKMLDPTSSNISFYPVGLAYGTLCVNLYWLKGQDLSKISFWSLQWLHVIAFGAVTIALAIYGGKLLIVG